MELGNYLLGFIPSGEPDVAREPDLKPLSDFRASLAHLQVAHARQARTVADRHARSLFAPARCLDHFVCDQATGRDAQGESDRRAVRRLRLGDEPEASGRADHSRRRRPANRTRSFKSANNPGFVHTPSLTQASTVAMLRSGHLAHAGNQAPNDLLAIDLSSERVRLATWLLDGVRQGQPLGALLGLPVRAPLAGSRKGAVHFVLPRARAAGGAEAGTHSRCNRSKPSPPTTSWTAWSCSAAGRRRWSSS